MNITFNDFGVDDTGVFGFTARDDEQTTHLTFALPERFLPAPDLIGIAISTLTGKKYDSIRIDLPISTNTKKDIERLTAAAVSAPDGPSMASGSHGKFEGLNFSGGFDSLAALSLMPDNTKLVSLDFGGNFAREREFYSQFNPTSIATNFRTKGFAANCWAFMGIGSILLRDYLDIGTISFGTILEASPWNFRPNPNFSSAPQPWFQAAGLKQINPALGLTEVGTIMLIGKNYRSRIPESLSSLADTGTEKMTRKFLLLRIVESILSVNYNVADLPFRNSPHFDFGKNLSTDFLVLYILKKLGPESANQLVGNIPENVVRFVSQRRLEFYERLNSNFYPPLPIDSKQLIYAQCLEAGIETYTESDWEEFHDVVSLLSSWHASLIG